MCVVQSLLHPLDCKLFARREHLHGKHYQLYIAGIWLALKYYKMNKDIPYLGMYNAHPHFWPKVSGKTFFHFNYILIYLFIFRQLFFCIIKEFQHLFLNILQYKKFYVINNYKTQQQIQSISCVMCILIFSLKNLGKKVHIIHDKIWYL